MAVKCAKVNISIPISTLKQIDSIAEENGYSRSFVISKACAEYLNAVQNMPNVNKVLALMGALCDEVSVGNVSSEKYNQKLAELEQETEKLKGGS